MVFIPLYINSEVERRSIWRICTNAPSVSKENIFVFDHEDCDGDPTLPEGYRSWRELLQHGEQAGRRLILLDGLGQAVALVLDLLVGHHFGGGGGTRLADGGVGSKTSRERGRELEVGWGVVS